MPFSNRELQAAVSGIPDIKSEYHLIYVGIVPDNYTNIGPMSRRIATYKIGSFLFGMAGVVVSPLIVATAEVPFMAVPSTYPVSKLS
jgi:hypothetical protein